MTVIKNEVETTKPKTKEPRDCIDEIYKIWQADFSGLRLGQLMYNFFDIMGDCYYWGNDEFVAKLEEYRNGVKILKK